MSVIIPKTSDVSDSHILSSDLGYVGLPREAVLDNTATPAEQQAFDFLATISAGISATFFAPKAALIAGVAALLADCGSPGEAGDPTLALALNVDSKGGTTDEGDAITVGDNGRRGGGDILVASDNGGTSTPDDGMTVEDAKDDQNGTTDVVSPGDVDDALTAADDGGMSTPDDGMTLVDAEQDGAADASAQPDNEDTFVAADDGGMSIPDDGMTLVDAEQDGAADASAEPDDGDTFVAADDGGMNVPDDGMTPIDTIPDGVADDGAAEADIALAIPICKP